MTALEDRLQQAVAALQGGRPEEAEQLLRRALTAQPDDPQLMSNLASLLDSKGDGDGALAVFRRCLAAALDYASAHANLGIALERQDRATERCRPTARPWPRSHVG